MDNAKITADTSIEELEFPVRVYNQLKRAGIENVGGILSLTQEDLEVLKQKKNFLINSMDYIKSILSEHGFALDIRPVREL